MAKTRAMENRAIRQDALREQLAEQCRLQHIVENLKKIEGLDPAEEHFDKVLKKLQISNDQRIRLMGKYLPDLKSTELTGNQDSPLVHKIVQEIVDGTADTSSA